jgi:holo-[acyl-carrier protein] synthase
LSRVLGLGVDVVEVARFARVLARHGETFERRVFLSGEAGARRTAAARAAHLAGLFAAKEAALKALGTGWAHGLVFRHVEIERDERGAPALRLHGAAARRARELGVERSLVSITHDGPVAAAVVVLEGSPPETSA